MIKSISKNYDLVATILHQILIINDTNTKRHFFSNVTFSKQFTLISHH